MRLAAVIARDMAGAAGAVAFTYGFWSIWHPLGFIVGGSLVMGTVALHIWANG